MANIKRANASGITKPGTAISDVPDAPTIGTATGGSGAATVTYTAAATGGTATTFTATSSPGSVTGTGASPITISGLTNGTSYTFTVTASNSTGTSPASSASNSVTPESLGDMDPIAMVEVGSGGSATVTFSSIPATYTHLQVRSIARSTEAVSSNALIMYLNNVTTAASNYSTHLLSGNGANAQAYGSSNDVIQNVITAGSNTASNFGVAVFDILDYTNTNKTKTVRALGGYDDNGSSGIVRFSSGMLHSSTAAITTIRLNPSGGNFAQYSQFALYGIKDA